MSIIEDGHPIPAPPTVDCIECCMEQRLSHAPIPYLRIGNHGGYEINKPWTNVIYNCKEHGEQTALWGFVMVAPTNQEGE